MLQLILPLGLILCCLEFGSVSGLRLEDAEEGSCRGIHYKAMPHVDLNFVRTLFQVKNTHLNYKFTFLIIFLKQVDSLSYIPVANRYHYYHHASNHPRFHDMREFELYYNLCLTQNTSFANGDGTAFGFGGRPLGSYITRPRLDQPGVIDTTPINDGDSPYDLHRRERVEQYITLTDHRTFAFLANCWTGADQRSFDVFSLTPELSPTTKRMIEEHAVSLGFKREEIVFLNYNSCKGDILSESVPSNIGGKYHGGWLNKKKSSSIGFNPISLTRPAPLPNFPSLLPNSGFSSNGKVVMSRATINPSLGNNSLRKSSIGGIGGGISPKLSLASGANGWSR